MTTGRREVEGVEMPVRQRRRRVRHGGDYVERLLREEGINGIRLRAVKRLKWFGPLDDGLCHLDALYAFRDEFHELAGQYCWLTGQISKLERGDVGRWQFS